MAKQTQIETALTFADQNGQNFPIALENLKPWPEHGLAMSTCQSAGCRSMKKDGQDHGTAAGGGGHAVHVGRCKRGWTAWRRRQPALNSADLRVGRRFTNPVIEWHSQAMPHGRIEPSVLPPGR